MKLKTILASAACATAIVAMAQNNNIIEEVAWIIGDEPIYKSEIEQAYQDAQQDRVPIVGDPYCVLPEQIAIERLFLHQADLDTVEVQEAMVQQNVDGQMNYLITNLGSREKVEQYFNKPFNEIRDYYATSMRNRYRIGQVRQGLTKNMKVTPADVRRYFTELPDDSIPFVPLQVETQIITVNPAIPRQEIDDIKARLRDYSDRVNRGESDFSTLAILYSEDAGSSVRGGEIGFMGRAQLVPEYAAVAFNLNDTKKVSKIVETEYGFHIIQLIEKRGDRINTRHILLKPKVADKDLTDAIHRLDSVRTDIVDNHKFSFEEAARYISQDKDTRNSNGVMVNSQTGTTRFEMSQLPQEVARVVGQMEPGQVSEPFIMRDPTRDREIVAIVKLTNRIDAHRANLSDDYQQIKDMYENSAKEKMVQDWLKNKIRDTYVRIEDGWRGCDFQYDGWIKSK
ncbi:MAG: peptidylprolyl isomerase [Muribaculaceae bacterium]|nr:peptidylprolyl isomerase [Muribaculaceae bacterium]MCI9055246.1 peptidylprolyl isomerase [Muribaculaceae bacterium]